MSGRDDLRHGTYYYLHLLTFPHIPPPFPYTLTSLPPYPPTLSLTLTFFITHLISPSSLHQFLPTHLLSPSSSSSHTEEEHEQDLMDDEDVVKFHWDGKGRFMDVVKLTACLDEAREAQESMANYRER
jgi:hypothetical protein